MNVVIVEFLKVLAAMVVAGLLASAGLVGLGHWHRRRTEVRRRREIDKVAPPGSGEGHTGAVKLWYRGIRPAPLEGPVVHSQGESR